MKKIIIILIAVLLFSPCAFAKTGGSIECVGKNKLAVSLSSEYIQEQKMRQDKIRMWQTGDTITTESNTVIDEIRLKIDRYYFKLNYGIFDSLDIFLKAGTQREQLDFTTLTTDPNQWKDRFISDYNPLLGGGLKAHLLPVGELFDVGFSAQYLYSKGKLKVIETEFSMGGSGGFYDIDNFEVECHSWDVSLYFYKRFKFITPYIGAKYQNSIYKINGDLVLYIAALTINQNFDYYKFNQDMGWILFGGIDFHINKRLDANIELSTFGSRSVSFGLAWKF